MENGKRILTVVVEKSKSGFWCYAKEIDGVVGNGKTIEEAKEDQKEALKETIKFWEETDKNICKFEDYEFVYELDLPGIELVKYRQERQIEKGNTVEVDFKNNGIENMMQATKAIMTPHIFEFPKHWNNEICEELANRSLEERLEIAGAWICQTLDMLKLEKNG